MKLTWQIKRKHQLYVINALKKNRVFIIILVQLVLKADLTNEELAEIRKKRTFRKFQFRGVDLDQLLDKTTYVFF